MTKTAKRKGDAGERAEEHDDEARFLERYRPGVYPRPSVTVDLVVFTVIDKLLHVLLVRRSEHPFKGRWALPGGFVRVSDDRTDQGEDLDAAAHRELLEETGLSHTASANVFLEQVRTFGKPGRDPRMRVLSVAYYALVRPTLVPLIRAGGDVSHAKWLDLSELTGRGAKARVRRRRAASSPSITPTSSTLRSIGCAPTSIARRSDSSSSPIRSPSRSSAPSTKRSAASRSIPATSGSASSA